MKTNIETWIQHDTNPFIIFSDNGKVLYLNESAEYMLSFVNSKIVFDTIISYAPKQPSFEYIKENFIFGDFVYDYALIGYDNFEEIGVRFYKNIKATKKSIDLEKLELVNIYFLIDLARTYSLMEKEINFIDIFDPDLPEIRFDKEALITIFSKIYQLLSDNDSIKTEVKIKIGEYVKVNNKKYKILEIDFFADNIKKENIEYENVNIEFFNKKISLIFPLIT